MIPKYRDKKSIYAFNLTIAVDKQTGVRMFAKMGSDWDLDFISLDSTPVSLLMFLRKNSMESTFTGCILDLLKFFSFFQ